jgi:small subunit ribosomal protein S7
MAEKKTSTKAAKDASKENTQDTTPKTQVVTPVSFDDPRVKKFTNYIMKHGKRTVAQKVFADTMKEIQVNGHPNPQAVLETALENAAPDIMVKSKRI